MIIDFEDMLETANPEFKGGKLTFFNKAFNDGFNKIMQGRLEPGASIGLHTHYNESEIIYVLEGTGTVLFDGEEYPLRPEQCHYCPKGHDHSLINNGGVDLRFFSVITTQ